MKTTFKLSALVLALTLTACSSGGSSSPSALIEKAEDKAKDTVEKVTDKVDEVVKDVTNQDKSETPPAETPSAETPSAETPSTGTPSTGTPSTGTPSTGTPSTGTPSAGTETPSTGEPVTGEPVVQAKSYAGNYWNYGVYKNRFDYLSANDLETLVIDNNNISLSTGSKDINNHKSSDSTYDYNRFGHYAVPNKNPSIVMYSVGEVSDKIPTTGSYTYKGTAFYHLEEAGVKDATAQFNVNFAQKTVNGSITTSDKQTITLPQATINDSKGFEYHQGSTLFRGNFYGTDAAELGGVYKNERTDRKEESAVFGAKKQ